VFRYKEDSTRRYEESTKYWLRETIKSKRHEKNRCSGEKIKIKSSMLKSRVYTTDKQQF
jgi:hypothetical protein